MCIYVGVFGAFLFTRKTNRMINNEILLLPIIESDYMQLFINFASRYGVYIHCFGWKTTGELRELTCCARREYFGSVNSWWIISLLEWECLHENVHESFHGDRYSNMNDFGLNIGRKRLQFEREMLRSTREEHRYGYGKGLFWLYGNHEYIHHPPLLAPQRHHSTHTP